MCCVQLEYVFNGFVHDPRLTHDGPGSNPNPAQAHRIFGESRICSLFPGCSKGSLSRASFGAERIRKGVFTGSNSKPLIRQRSSMKFTVSKHRGGFFKLATLHRWLVIVTGTQYIEELRKASEDELAPIDAASQVRLYQHSFLSSSANNNITLSRIYLDIF